MDFFSEWLGELGIKSEVTVRESNKLTNDILDGEYDVFHWGWYVEPDPDVDPRRLHLRPAWRTANDSWYCNPEYDALMNAAEAARWTRPSGSRQIKQMQQMLFEDSPYLVLAYTADGQAYRSDRFACFVPQPKPDGVLLMQYGAYNYQPAAPDQGRRRLRRRGPGGRGQQRLVERVVVGRAAAANVVLIGGARARAGPGRGGGGVVAFRRRATAASASDAEWSRRDRR